MAPDVTREAGELGYHLLKLEYLKQGDSGTFVRKGFRYWKRVSTTFKIHVDITMVLITSVKC